MGDEARRVEPSSMDRCPSKSDLESSLSSSTSEDTVKATYEPGSKSALNLQAP